MILFVETDFLKEEPIAGVPQLKMLCYYTPTVKR